MGRALWMCCWWDRDRGASLAAVCVWWKRACVYTHGIVVRVNPETNHGRDIHWFGNWSRHIATCEARGKRIYKRPLFRKVVPEAFSKMSDYVIDGVYDFSHLGTQIPTFRNKVTFHCYLHSKMALELDLFAFTRLESRNVETNKFRFIFEKISANKLDAGNFDARTRIEMNADLKDGGSNHMKPPVSIDSGVVMEKFQISRQSVVRMTRIVSYIRLYGQQPIPQFLREWWFVDGILTKFSFIDTNWEFYAVLIGGGIYTFHICRSLIDQAIKSSTELIEKLTQLKRHIVFRDSREASLDYTLCPVVAYFDSHGMSFRTGEAVPLRMHGFSMRYRTLNTPTTIGEQYHAARVTPSASHYLCQIFLTFNCEMTTLLHVKYF